MNKPESLPTADHLYSYYELLTTDPEFHTGRMNEKLLGNLVDAMNNDPTYDNVFHFVNCLDFFYSTGLKYSDKAFQSKQSVAELIRNNWNSGIVFSEVPEREVNFDKVEAFREKLKSCFSVSKKKDYYSFVTKVFHNLNSSYFIWDRNVCHFLIKHGLASSNMKGKPYKEYYSVLMKLKTELKWPHDHDKLDLAIWSIVNKHSTKYGIKKEDKNASDPR